MAGSKRAEPTTARGDVGAVSQVTDLGSPAALIAANQQIERLRAALEQSLKLQSHYAWLLNEYDGGKRMRFDSVEAWLARLAI